MTIIVLFGAPGSGKGTHGVLISERFGYIHLSTGSILREEVEKNTDMGIEIESYISKGDLVPDEMICNIVEKKITEHLGQKGIIFDGFPRNIYQAKFLDKVLEKKGLKINLMIDIQTQKQELIKRLIKRGTLSHRSDDTNETIQKRLKIYEDQTKPVIDFYKKTERYNKIDSEGTIEEVFAEILDLIVEKQQ